MKRMINIAAARQLEVARTILVFAALVKWDEVEEALYELNPRNRDQKLHIAFPDCMRCDNRHQKHVTQRSNFSKKHYLGELAFATNCLNALEIRTITDPNF